MLRDFLLKKGLGMREQNVQTLPIKNVSARRAWLVVQGGKFSRWRTEEGE